MEFRHPYSFMKAFDFKPSDLLIIKAQLLPLIFKIATTEEAGRFSQENLVFILCSIVEDVRWI